MGRAQLCQYYNRGRRSLDNFPFEKTIIEGYAGRLIGDPVREVVNND